MFRNNSQSWIPIYFCSVLSIAGIILSLSLIISLIPVYLSNHSVDKSDTIYPVYTVENVSFTIGDTVKRQIRIKRDTDLSSVLPSAVMIASIQLQLNNLFNEIDGRVVVSKASMPSTAKLILTLKVYFLRGCIACQLRQQQLIKQILKKSQTTNVYVQYYTNCILDPITVGTIPITLSDDAINTYTISKATQTSIESLVQQPDLCANRATLVYPTDCSRTEASGTVTAMLVSDDTSRYYCYYFVPPASASNINLQFGFSSYPGTSFGILYGVSLNSTVNLITNGDFDTYNLDASNNYNWPPWTSTACGTFCNTAAGVPSTQTDISSFLSTGNGIVLSQSVAISTVGRQFVHRLGFWFQCLIDMDSPCLFYVTLTTT